MNFQPNLVGDPPQYPANTFSQSADEERSPQDDYVLKIRQQPLQARIAMGKEKDRKPIDPPPIVQLTVSTRKDPMQMYLQSPYYFMSCSLINASETQVEVAQPNQLFGSLVSSLHRLKDQTNVDGGFFIWGDVSVKQAGHYKLQFSLFRIDGEEVSFLTSVYSHVFEAFIPKAFPGMQESTFLTRSFSDQGVRLRLRKDSRSVTTRKRNQSAADGFRKARQGSYGQSGGQDSIPDTAIESPSSVAPNESQVSGTFYEVQPRTPTDYYAQIEGVPTSKRRRMLSGPDGTGYLSAQDMEPRAATYSPYTMATQMAASQADYQQQQNIMSAAPTGYPPHGHNDAAASQAAYQQAGHSLPMYHHETRGYQPGPQGSGYSSGLPGLPGPHGPPGLGSPPGPRPPPSN